MPNGRNSGNPSNPQTEEHTAELAANTLALNALINAIGGGTGGVQPHRQLTEKQLEEQKRIHQDEPRSLVEVLEDSLNRSSNKRGGEDQKQPKSEGNVGTRLASSVTGAITGSIGGIIGLLTSKLVTVLAPVALLATAISGKTSGASQFLEMIQLMGTVLAGLLMPAFLVMGGVVFAAAMALQAYLLPRLKEYYTTVIQGLIDATKRLTTAFNVASDIFSGKGGSGATGKAGSAIGDAVGSVIDDFKNSLQAWGSLFDKIDKSQQGQQKAKDETKRLEEFQKGILEQRAIGAVIGGVTAGIQPKTPEEKLEESRKQAEEEAKKPPTFLVNMFKGMDMMLRTMERDINPPAQRSGLVEAYKQAQIQALNVRPIEQEMRKIMLDQLAAARDALDELRKIYLPEPTTH